MTSIYDKKDTLEKQRMDSDLIYHCLMSKDETILNKTIQDIYDLTVAEFPQASQRFRTMMSRVISDKPRVAKHAALMFGLYLTPAYAQRLVTEAKVDVHRFQYFYTYDLPRLCTAHLNGAEKVDSLQAFVEEIRIQYIII
jgi:hypothetical protein